MSNYAGPRTDKHMEVTMNKPLNEYTVEELTAALETRRAYEFEKVLAANAARFPKCKCGKPATNVVLADVTYSWWTLRADQFGRPNLGSLLNEGDDCPGEDGVECDIAWVCCDGDGCGAWTSVPAADVRT